jgi:hypothetical protein
VLLWVLVSAKQLVQQLALLKASLLALVWVQPWESGLVRMSAVLLEQPRVMQLAWV